MSDAVYYNLTPWTYWKQRNVKDKLEYFQYYLLKQFKVAQFVTEVLFVLLFKFLTDIFIITRSSYNIGYITLCIEMVYEYELQNEIIRQ